MVSSARRRAELFGRQRAVLEAKGGRWSKRWARLALAERQEALRLLDQALRTAGARAEPDSGLHLAFSSSALPRISPRRLILDPGFLPPPDSRHGHLFVASSGVKRLA